MKQTAVEFLIEEIKPFLSMPIEDAYKTILQAKEMESQKEYETKAYWFGRGVLAGRENRIAELQPQSNTPTSSQTEISDAGKDTADYIDRHIIESMKELAREGFKPQVSEISDEEIEEMLFHHSNEYAYGFKDAIKWYREQLKSRQ
jgi:hypothetical protein